jgi:peptidoglycan/LPS O-acetylase OafA/YrhL
VFASHSLLGESLNRFIQFDFLRRLIQLGSSGHLGVSFFFVLSGFLITYLMFEEKKSTHEFNVKKFFIRRALRIWPLYFCTLAFSFFVYPAVKEAFGYVDQNPFHFAYQALFLSNFDCIIVQHKDLIGVSPMMISINWSVAIEEQFYLLWPLVFLSINSRKLWIVCFILVLLSWIFRANNIRDGAVLYYHSLSVASDLAVGGLGAYLSFFNEVFLNGLKQLKRPVIVFVYGVGLALLMYSDILFNGFFGQTTFRLMQTLFFCFVILEQNNCEQSFFKIGNWPRLSFMGRYTYGLYMLHAIGIQVAIVYFRYAGFAQDENIYFSLLYVAISLFVSMSLSVVSYHVLESHFLRWRNIFH